MGKKCAVIKCPNSEGKPIGIIHQFPKVKTLREEWTKSLRGQLRNVNLENFGVCGLHFQNDDYKYSGPNKENQAKLLRPIAVPRHSTNSNENSTTVLNPLGALNTNNTTTQVSYISSLETELHQTKEELKIKRKVIKKKDKLIFKLRSKCEDLQIKVNTGTKNLDLLRTVSEMFSPKQLQKLKGTDSFVHWSDDDIAKAIALDSVSAKAYDYIRTVHKYPLPSRRTVRRWLGKIEVQPGILKCVLDLLQGSFKHSPRMERIACIAADEMSISNRLCYDSKNDQILGGSEQMLDGNVVMWVETRTP